MSQAAPTFCIQVPTLETKVAVQRARNTECLKGLQAETVSTGEFIWRPAFSHCKEICFKDKHGPGLVDDPRNGSGILSHNLGLVGLPPIYLIISPTQVLFLYYGSPMKNLRTTHAGEYRAQFCSQPGPGIDRPRFPGVLTGQGCFNGSLPASKRMSCT